MKIWLRVILLLVGLCSVDAKAVTGSLALQEVLGLVAPDTRIDVGPPKYTKSMSTVFRFSSNPTGARYECSIDAAEWITCVSPMGLDVFTDGRHTFSVRAVDSAGNKDPSPAQHEWNVDTVPPNVQVLQPSNGGVVNSLTPTFTGRADDPFCSVQVFVDDAPVGTATADKDGNWSFSVTTSLANGSHKVSAEATDPAGNKGPRSTSNTFSMDMEPPDTTIVEGPPRSHNSRLAAFSFNSPSGATQFDCQLDEAPAGFTACGAEWLFTKLDEGPHTLKVRARDSAGNVDPTPAVYKWTVNLHSPPSPEISEPAEGAMVDTQTPVISGKATANGLVVIFIDDKQSGVAQANEEGMWSLRPTTSLDEGEHKLTAEAKDTVGNTSEQRSPVRSFSVALGGCSASGSQPVLPLLGLGLALFARRRRRS